MMPGLRVDSEESMRASRAHDYHFHFDDTCCAFENTEIYKHFYVVNYV
jgi:hypothetical protein